MISHHPFSLISESYRTIRTALLLSQAEKPPQAILLTSAHPGEGKTMTTLNLAIALAQSGRAVVVVDADLRKGNCHTLLRQRNYQGLSNILTNGWLLDESVRETIVPGFSLLSRGGIPPNPADLLGSPKMKEVLEALRARFDFVLVDSPPAVAVSDATALSPLCDGVLLVLHGQKTTIQMARLLLEHLEAAHARILGVVLNGVDVRSPDYAYYRRYYKSYYASVVNGDAEEI
jgi:capsular exopolysaccharide synthesis family protein